MINQSKFNETMRTAAEKLNFSKASLQGAGGSIRDDQGFSFTSNRILTSIENFLDSGSNTKFALDEAIVHGIQNNFSRTKGNFSASDLGSVMDVDVADISIAATIASHGLTYIAMERAMDAVGQNITFQGLKAINGVAGYEAGQKVVDPRIPLSPMVDLGRFGDGATASEESDAIASGDDKTFEFGKAVIAGETKVFYKGEMIAFTTNQLKPNKDGIEEIVLKKGGVFETGTVNIQTGEVKLEKFATVINAGELEVKVCIDRIADKTGDSTLKLKPYMESIEIVATENRVILQSSVEVQAQMNKILRKNATYGINVDFGKRAIDQVVMLYTYFIDVNVVRALWEGAKGLPIAASINLSGYSGGGGDYKSFASTKNDRLSMFTRTLVSSFLTKTGSPLTALIVDEVAAIMYSTDSENFKTDPAFAQRRDGLIGYYQNIPVIRNVYLNNKAGDGIGLVLGVHKSLNGECAPVVFGDYLPPYSTLPAINANNPGELSQALFSQTATKCVVPEFIIKGTIIPYVNAETAPSSSI